jgi:hypothetical protein
VRLEDALLTEAKKCAAAQGRSLTAVIEDALREVLSRKGSAPTAKGKIIFPTFKGRGLKAGVDLDSAAALLDVMEENP